jgi:hypothetical protein
LIVGQVALAVVLLSGAGLLVLSLHRVAGGKIGLPQRRAIANRTSVVQNVSLAGGGWRGEIGGRHEDKNWGVTGR